MRTEDEARLVTRALSLSVQQKTFADGDAAAFRRLHTILGELFPRVFSQGEAEVSGERALLIHLPGLQGAQPLVFLSHMDVVPAHFLKDWTLPPFSGAVRDGYVHGRGTLDMKGHMCALLTAAESLLADGRQPKGDIYFAFSADEETRGGSMRALCALLKARDVSPAFVLDEGGFVTNYTRFHKAPAALVGVAEKGHVRFSVRAEADVGAERLLRAGAKLSRIRFAPRLTPTVQTTLEALAPTAGGAFGLCCRHLNVGLARRAVLSRLSHTRGERGMVRSSVALQRLSGDALYYEPPTLTYYASLLHGDTAEQFVARLERLLRREMVNISVDLIEEPSMISPAGGPAFEALTTAINVNFPHVRVAPYLLPGGSDARRMELLCPYVYRFSPFVVSRADMALIHHANERISVENLTRGVQFFKQMLQA